MLACQNKTGITFWSPLVISQRICGQTSKITNRSLHSQKNTLIGLDSQTNGIGSCTDCLDNKTNNIDDQIDYVDH